MQFSTDTALAAALDVGQNRILGVKLMIDWNRDGLFADANSDMSAYVDEWNSDRSLVGVIPDELQTTEGYLTGKITIKLSGELADGTPLWKMFSPYSGYGTYGNGAALNTPMYLQVIVKNDTGTTSWNIDQFTGWVDSAKPSRAAGTVTMVCLDGGGQLETGITVDRWGADQYRREVVIVGDPQSNNVDEMSESCTIEAGWLIDSALRRTGFYEGPVWHPGAVHTRTLRGSMLPEVGAWNAIPISHFDNINWSSGMIFSTPHVGPAMERPVDVWSKTAGKYGPAFIGSARLGTWRSDVPVTRNITKFSSGTNASLPITVTTYGGNNSNIMGWSGWVYVDSTLSAEELTTDDFALSATTFDGILSSARIEAQILHKAGTVTFRAYNDSAQTWTWTNSLGANGWHFVSFTWQFTSTQIWGSLWLDGVRVTNQTNGGRVGPMPVSSHTWIEGATNSVYLGYLAGPLQYTQWIYAPDTPIASYVQPVSTPPTIPRQQAKVDLTGQRLHYFPNIEQAPAGDVIQSVTAADLGAFYFTEQGVATFDSRDTIRNRQTYLNVSFDLTLDNSMDFAPASAYVSVANRIGYTAKYRVGQPYLHAFEASKPDQFLIAPSTTRRFLVTLNDVQSFRSGPLTVRPFAQGYDVGLVPPTQFWQEYMQHYGPAYWREGFTGYQPGSQPASGPPPQLGNTSVYALPGWFNIDTNDRHLRVAPINNNASIWAQFSVNDSTAFLVVGGTVLQDRPAITESTSDATSIARFRERVFNLPADEWHQDIIWLRILATSLLVTTKNPTTQFEDIEVVGDPRRQLQDVCRVVDPDRAGNLPGMTGQTVAYGSVVGIKRKFSRSGDGAKLVDTLTIRTF